MVRRRLLRKQTFCLLALSCFGLLNSSNTLAFGPRRSNPPPAPAPAPPPPVPTPAPSLSPTPTPTPTPTLSPGPVGEYDLGNLPAGFSVRFPDAPRITRTVDVSTLAQLNTALAEPGTRVRVRANISSNVSISTSDHEIVVDAGVSLRNVFVARSVKRLRFIGGTYTGIALDMPKIWYPSEQTDPAWFVEDVLFDGVRVNAPSGAIAFTLRGNRIAVLRSVATAGTYSVWFGDHAPAQASDVIIAGNHFTSSGAESTLRVHDANRVALVDNVLINGNEYETSKHNLRLHGTVDRAWLARNICIWSGSMVGINDSGDHDQIGELWYENNTFYMTRMSLFRAEGNHIDVAHIRGNVSYSNAHTCFLCGGVPQGWDVGTNPIYPYQRPPQSLLSR